MIEIKLSKPVMSEGEEINILKFREPIAEDIIACGYPFRLYIGSATDSDSANNQEMRIDTAVLASLASRLAGVPKSTIKNLDVADFGQIITVLSGFFG